MYHLFIYEEQNSYISIGPSDTEDSGVWMDNTNDKSYKYILCEMNKNTYIVQQVTSFYLMFRSIL